MKYLFLLCTIACLAAGCSGPEHRHQLGLAAVSLLITIALWSEHLDKNDPNREAGA